MPEWVWIVLFLILIFIVVPTIWTRLEERSGTVRSATRSAESASDAIGGCVVRLVGVGTILLGVIGIVVGLRGGVEWFLVLGGVVLLAYGIYLVTPGERSLFIIF